MGFSDRRAAAVGRRLDQDLAGRPGPSEATGDPYMAGWLGRRHPGANQPRPESGTLIDAIPGAALYLVSAGARSLLWCSPGGTTAGFGSVGGRPLHTFVPGATVYFIRHPETPYLGTIIAAEPHWSTHTGYQPADGIWPFVRSGQRAEAAHQYPVRASADLAARTPIPLAGVDLADLSAGRPVDQTAAGEWGVMMETGVGVFADPFQAYLRADEATGVFAFYPDQLLRVAGHNYQWRTAVGELEHLEDEGELYGHATRCVYPWEAYGLWRWNQVTPGWAAAAAADHGLAPGQGTAFVDPAEVQAASGDAVREPEDYAQLPAARDLRWAGYLGQGGHRLTAAPAAIGRAGAETAGAEPSDARSVEVEWTELAGAPGGRLEVKGNTAPAAQAVAVPANRRGGPDQPGLLEEHRTLTGGLHYRTSRRILLVKRPSIPTPRPVRRPEDPAGDAPGGAYHPSGLDLALQAAAHLVAADVPPTGAPHRAAAFDDALAYHFNWEGLHPFAYHAEDWHVAQEGDAGSALVNQVAPVYADLEDGQFLDPPAPSPDRAVDVDHRYGEADVYENTAGLGILDDGTVVITDGWGSEIRMTAGGIDLRCAGDVNVHPGRNLIVWAGHDVVLRAHDSVDLTAANGDLRTKAEYNHHSLAGNSGCGGFLMETKAVCGAYAFAGRVGEDVISSGFTVLAPRSQFLVLARDATVQLTEPEGGEEQGRIYLDAGEERDIHTRSRSLVSRVTGGSVVHLFDGGRANEFTHTHTLLGPNVMSPGSAYFARCVFAGEWLYAGTHVATGRGGLVGVRAEDYSGTTAALAGREDYLSGLYLLEFEAQSLYPPTALDAEFTCRNSRQYRSDEYEFWRSRWEAIAAGDSQTLTVWSEPVVTGLRSGLPTQPHPGERWTDESSYRYHTETFTDPVAGWTAIDRDAGRATYEAGAYEDPGDDRLDAAYPVSVPAGPP